jgi:hypothetical protein
VEQLALGFDRSAEALQRSLQDRLSTPIEVVVTDNRKIMVSSRRAPGALRVRVHRMFLEAPGHVIDALARYLRHREPEAAETLGRFVGSNRDRIHKRPRVVRLHARGKVHDLLEILEEVVRDHFPEGVSGVRIAWGNSPPDRRRHSIRLGTYTHDHALVRVHPGLDQTFVPRYFVAFVIFHEVLHHVLPPVRRGSRVLYHTARFRDRERMHPDYERAMAWERDHIDRLLARQKK